MTDITRTGGAPLPQRMFVLLSVRLRFCIFGGRGATLLFSVVWLQQLTHTHAPCIARLGHAVYTGHNTSQETAEKIEYKTDFLFYFWSIWCRGVKGWLMSKVDANAGPPADDDGGIEERKEHRFHVQKEYRKPKNNPLSGFLF